MLPLVLLNTHVQMSVIIMIARVFVAKLSKWDGSNGPKKNAIKKMGRCHTPCRNPKTKLPTNGPYFCSNLGSANPRQPGSSPQVMIPGNTRIAGRYEVKSNGQFCKKSKNGATPRKRLAASRLRTI